MKLHRSRSLLIGSVIFDELVRQTEQALASTDSAHRQWAKAQIQNATLPVVARGYDRGQVDAHLAALASQF